MSAVPKLVDDRLSIYQLAGIAFGESKGNTDVARQRLLGQIKRNPELVDDAIAWAVDHFLSLQRSNVRQAQFNVIHTKEDYAVRSDRATRGGDNGLAARAASNIKGLMSYILPRTMKKLGDAKKEDVQAAYMWYRGARTGHGIRERWLLSIWKAMKDEATPVRQQLNEEDLVNFEKRARRDEESK